jgi:hypothetical protein
MQLNGKNDIKSKTARKFQLKVTFVEAKKNPESKTRILPKIGSKMKKIFGHQRKRSRPM